jgi:hypothetical protein
VGDRIPERGPEASLAGITRATDDWVVEEGENMNPRLTAVATAVAPFRIVAVDAGAVRAPGVVEAQRLLRIV